ncbi:hypothetical protein LSAT2_004794 [Lamellibrachia satsuma]|nr:hypothetical protein LSAT2_004794 [Lamellibrachia satsuma]
MQHARAMNSGMRTTSGRCITDMGHAPLNNCLFCHFRSEWKRANQSSNILSFSLHVIVKQDYFYPTATTY